MILAILSRLWWLYNNLTVVYRHKVTLTNCVNGDEAALRLDGQHVLRWRRRRRVQSRKQQCTAGARRHTHAPHGALMLVCFPPTLITRRVFSTLSRVTRRRCVCVRARTRFGTTFRIFTERVRYAAPRLISVIVLNCPASARVRSVRVTVVTTLLSDVTLVFI